MNPTAWQPSYYFGVVSAFGGNARSAHLHCHESYCMAAILLLWCLVPLVPALDLLIYISIPPSFKKTTQFIVWMFSRCVCRRSRVIAMSSDRKELRKTMRPFENVLMALMPTSIATSIYLVVVASTTENLHRSVAAISAFYCSWAIFNFLTTKPQEKGQYPLLLCCVGCLLGGRIGRYMAITGSLGTCLAFAFVGQKIASWPASKLAYMSRKTLTWAHIMQLYVATSFGAWAFFTYRLAVS